MFDLFKVLQETYKTKMQENTDAVMPDKAKEKEEEKGEPKEVKDEIKKAESPDTKVDATAKDKSEEPKEQGK